MQRTCLQNPLTIIPIVFGLLSLVGLGSTQLAQASNQPNIVMIIADDAGYVDYGFMGSNEMQTANLDELALRSSRFSQAYVQSTCSPSRASLLTGLIPQRFGFDRNCGKPTPAFFAETGDGLPAEQITLFERLGELGYTSAMIGKWHQGFVKGHSRPNDQGADYFFGFLAGSRGYFGGGTDKVGQLMREQDEIVEPQIEGQYLTDVLGDATVRFVSEHVKEKPDEPFFAYVSFNSPHTPLQAKEDDLARFPELKGKRKIQAAMQYAMDRNVGKILQQLKQSSLVENTIVVFFNDNGGSSSSGSNGPLRSSKGSVYEGGLRTPLLISGPGFSAGTNFEHPVSAMDLTPTLVGIAGGKVTGLCDGVDLRPYLKEHLATGHSDPPHPQLYFRHAGSLAVRDGRWKYVRPRNPSGYYATSNIQHDGELYDLQLDPGEKTNVASQHPRIVRRLQQLVTKYEVQLQKPAWGRFGRRDRNYLDRFVYRVAEKHSHAGKWSDKRAWHGLNSIDANEPYGERMTTQDGNANTIVEFPAADVSYTATNDLVRMSGLNFLVNQIHFTGNQVSAKENKAHVDGKEVLLVKSLAAVPPAIVNAAITNADNPFGFDLSVNLILYDDLAISGDGNGPLKIHGVISDFDQPRSVSKSGKSLVELTGANTYSGSTTVNNGTLRLRGTLKTRRVHVQDGGLLGDGTIVAKPRTDEAFMEVTQGMLDIRKMSLDFHDAELTESQYTLVAYEGSGKFLHQPAPAFFGEVQNLPAEYVLKDTGKAIVLARKKAESGEAKSSARSKPNDGASSNLPGEKEQRAETTSRAKPLDTKLAASSTRAPMWQHEILPVLKRNCTSCHSEEESEAELDLTQFDRVMKGGISGAAIVPGHPEMSLLWKMIESDKMPEGEPLSAAEKQLIKTWIKVGRFPSSEKLNADREAFVITPEARKFWSFVAPVKSAVPDVQNTDQVRTPIDAFVLEKLEEKGWKLRPEANRTTLVRRAYFDLIGLPPTPEEVDTFVNDPTENAYEKLIDRLLESEHYGERWGRHWLDVAGYSDSTGDAGDVLRPASYKYRNYVIRAFNDNKPFDQFLIEQLAGDQLVNWDPNTRPRPDQIEALTATGFNRLTADITDNQKIYQVDKWFDALQKSTETSLKAFLGLTIGCARCHDHKFDPILQKDYYRLTASFHASYDTSNWLASNIKYGQWPSRYILDMPDAERQAWIKQKKHSLSKKLKRTFELIAQQIEDGAHLNSIVDMEGNSIAASKEFTHEQVQALYAENGGLKNKQLKEIFPQLSKQAAQEKKIEANLLWALWDVSKNASPTHLLLRGNYLSPGPVVEPGILTILDNSEAPFEFPDPSEHEDWHHTGRRLTLAKWMTQSTHPLTSRVFVNRVWQYHFGEGIVASPDDFGVKGFRPTHPKLLDWLAVDFVEGGWNIKRMHRQIMLSAVYRQDSSEDADKIAVDPGNKLLWRKAPLRLDAEVIRDSILSVSGLLNKTMFSTYDPIKKSDDGQFVPNTSTGPKDRRSIYLAQSRTRPIGFLLAFDMPTMTQNSVAKRFRSARPSQALVMLNNPLVRRASIALADRVAEEQQDWDKRIVRAYQLAYSRPPSESEMQTTRHVIDSTPDSQRGFEISVQAMLGSNDFLYSY